MNQLEVFNNEQFGEIRTTEIDSKVYFCGSDVAKALGYKNPWDAIKRHCKSDGVVKHEGVSETINQYGVSTEQTVEMTFITEGNVYRLITHSKLPEAEKFEKWVFDEVLPTIRKHGAYMTPETLEKAILNPDTLIKLCMELKESREKNKRLEEENAVQSQQLAELQPKASYYDVVLNCKDLLAIGKIAKDFGWSAKKMNKYLHEKRVQFKQGDIWLLYQKYANKGYTSTKTQTFNGNDGMVHTSVHTYWTQKGRLFIYDLLKSEDILPLIEKG